jgi:spore maturation protein CgeB
MQIPPITKFFVRRAPTVLMVGEFESSAPFRHFARGFRQCGWDVLEMDTSRHLSGLGYRWVDGALNRLLPRMMSERLAAEIASTATRLPLDMVMFAKGFGATPRLLNTLRSKGIKTLNWYPDFHFEYPEVIHDALPFFDMFVTTKRHQMAYLKALRGKRPTWMIDHGYCNSLHEVISPILDDKDKPYDIAYVGNRSPYKEKWIRHIVNALPELTFALVGNGGWADAFPGPRQRVYINGGLQGQQMARLFAHVKIGLAFHHGPAGRFGWQDTISARTFEIPAAGCFMLHIDSGDVRSLYNIPGEIDCFSTPEDAVKQIRRYLTQPELRNKMARRAHARTVSEYSYEQIGSKIANLALSELAQAQ